MFGMTGKNGERKNATSEGMNLWGGMHDRYHCDKYTSSSLPSASVSGRFGSVYRNHRVGKTGGYLQPRYVCQTACGITILSWPLYH